MRALWPALAVSALLAASGAAPAAVAGFPPVTVLPPLTGKTPSPATAQEAVAVARGGQDIPSVLARPFEAELGWTAQWRGGGWWLVGVYESDWGTRFVVRATVEGRYARFGVGPTRQWILDNAQPHLTTLYARFDPATAVAQMEKELLAFPPPADPNQYPNFDPGNYTILDGAATLVRDQPSGPSWWFVYYALDHRTGQNVVVPVTGAGYDPPVPEGSMQTDRGASVYGFRGVCWPRNDVQPADPKLVDWIDSVIAARGWRPADWPSTGRDETFWSIPPTIPRPPKEVTRKAGGTAPSPTTAKAAVAVAEAGPDIPSVLAEPYLSGGNWTAQWRGHEWWLAAVFRSEWGKRFVVRATVNGKNVQFGAGPRKRWIEEHAGPRSIRTLYTRLKPWSAVRLLKAELLAGPVSQFDPSRYSLLAGSAELAQDVPQTARSGPMWYAVYYAEDRSTGKDVVLPVTAPSHGPLVEQTYDTSTPGSTAYGFEDFDVLGSVPSALAAWVRGVVARRGWQPTNFR